MRRKFLPYCSARIKKGLARVMMDSFSSHHTTQLTTKQPPLPPLTTNGFLRHAQFCLFHLLGARDRVSAHNSHRLRWKRGQWYWLHNRVSKSSAAYLTDMRKFNVYPLKSHKSQMLNKYSKLFAAGHCILSSSKNHHLRSLVSPLRLWVSGGQMGYTFILLFVLL